MPNWEYDEERIEEMTSIIESAGEQVDLEGEILEFAEYLTSLCKENNQITADFVKAGLLRILSEPIIELQKKVAELEKTVVDMDSRVQALGARMRY